MSSFTPSPQQAAFFDWIETGTGSAVLEAVAGAGKTTTLVHALRLMRGNVFLGAYNKKIATEIADRTRVMGLERPTLKVSTMHAAGYGAWRRVHSRVEIDGKKTYKLIDAAFARSPKDYALADTYAALIAKLVSLGKQCLVGMPGGYNWAQIMDHFSIRDEMLDDIDEHTLLRFTSEFMMQSREACSRVIDFDDMIYAPLAFGARMFRNDWVLIDECQDLNPARLALARMMLKPTGRLVAVGDRRQAIYGFAGAGADSIDKIIETFKCVTMPLTTTYRCPKSVVSFVHQWVSHIQAAATAPEGIVRPVREVKGDAAWFVGDRPANGDAILCRYTAPLVTTAFMMLRQGIACRIEGRDIGAQLVALARRWKVTTLAALEKRLADYQTRETMKAGDDEIRVLSIADRVETLRVVMERCRADNRHTVADLVSEIEGMFGDDVARMNVVVLSTGHKAKGREWNRVFWIECQRRTRRKLLAWEEEQEANVSYVIGTRAMHELIRVPESLVTGREQRKAA